MLAASACFASVTWCSGEGCDILEALSEGREPPKPPKPKKSAKKARAKSSTAGKFATLPSFARVISLPGEDARWEQVVVELGAMGLEARRAVAVTPSELSASKLLRVRPVGAGGEPFGPKELACGMSHLKAWREIADGDEPYGLIVEDDAVLHPRATRELLAATVAQLPASFTVAWLGSCYSHLEMGGVSELPRDRALVRGAARCTHAYLVSKDGAARLVQELSILRDAVDRQMAQLCTLRFGDCYVAYPRWRRPAGSRLWGHGLLLQDWRFSSAISDDARTRLLRDHDTIPGDDPAGESAEEEEIGGGGEYDGEFAAHDRASPEPPTEPSMAPMVAIGADGSVQHIGGGGGGGIHHRIGG